ncbi:hypothetical protein D6817_00700 [Candidatus Pacearchaeota archaeon]|nr:MAG: hypothetical protein D6817_00700 [Candidatus Pacearchaeota archaeon]
MELARMTWAIVLLGVVVYIFYFLSLGRVFFSSELFEESMIGRAISGNAISIGILTSAQPKLSPVPAPTDEQASGESSGGSGGIQVTPSSGGSVSGDSTGSAQQTAPQTAPDNQQPSGESPGGVEQANTQAQQTETYNAGDEMISNATNETNVTNGSVEISQGSLPKGVVVVEKVVNAKVSGGANAEQASAQSEGTRVVERKCVDSEPFEGVEQGRELFVRGSVRVYEDGKIVESGLDECDLSSGKLVEWSCTPEANLAKKLVDCSLLGNYVCSNGACVEREETGDCVDTDGGDNPAQKGKVVFENSIYEDACIGRKTLIEYYCSSNRAKSKVVECGGTPEKLTCIQGRCVELEKESALLQERATQGGFLSRVRDFFSSLFG